jgi:short-subunit dehydrogenase
MIFFFILKGLLVNISMMIKKVIIVGASSGIGKELASIYAARGHQVAITGRRANLLHDLQQTIPGLLTSCFDVMGQDNQQKISDLINALGGLDLLIFNAGYGDTSRNLNWEVERTTTLTNVLSFVEIASFSFNYFVEQGKGQIAVTSSLAALRGNSWAPAYSASKAFMSNYAEGLNIKARRLNKDIIVTDIKPGFVNTKIAKGNKRFWTASPHKAAIQIVSAIESKRRVVYVTKRWWIIAQLMKLLPYSLYRRLA